MSSIILLRYALDSVTICFHRGLCSPILCSCSLPHLLQVINRDLSIAVLRYFVRQRQKEIAEGILKAPRPKRTPAEAAQLKHSAGDMQSCVLLYYPCWKSKHQKQPDAPRTSSDIMGSVRTCLEKSLTGICGVCRGSHAASKAG